MAKKTKGQRQELLTIGRVVHYVLAGSRPQRGEHRPAMITGLLARGVALVVAKCHADDSPNLIAASFLVPNVPYSESCEPGTWHWPERGQGVPMEVNEARASDPPTEPMPPRNASPETTC